MNEDATVNTDRFPALKGYDPENPKPPQLSSLTEIRIGPRGDMTLDFLPKVVAEVELDKIKIGEALRELRLERRISATYMAAAANTSLPTISRMAENGVAGVAVIRRYAEALGLEAVIVFREVDRG